MFNLVECYRCNNSIVVKESEFEIVEVEEKKFEALCIECIKEMK